MVWRGRGSVALWCVGWVTLASQGGLCRCQGGLRGRSCGSRSVLRARVRFSSLSRARSPISVAPSRAKTTIDIAKAVSTAEGGLIQTLPSDGIAG